MLEHILNFDQAISFFMQNHVRCFLLDIAMKALSLCGDYGAIWILLAIVLFFLPETRIGAIFLLLSIAITALVAHEFLKEWIMRPRPYITYPDIQILVAPLYSTSFPSGHAASSFAAATALTIVFQQKGKYAFIVAGLIAISRVYVGVHYVSDILVGALLGVMISLWGGVILNWLRRKYSKNL